MTPPMRRGAVNTMYLPLLGMLLLLLGLSVSLWFSSSGSHHGDSKGQDELLMFCAAGTRSAVEPIVKRYAEEYGVTVRVQYGGSNTLLSQIEVNPTGDLYLAADNSYTQLAKEKGLVAEQLPVAEIRPVIIVQSGNPKGIGSIDDLLRKGLRVAIGSPDQAAVGKITRKLLTASGHWDRFEKHVQVMKPTVNDVANDVEIGSVDAGIVWDIIAALHPKLTVVRTPELDVGISHITLGILTASKSPTAALRFARYVTARDRGLKVFAEHAYHVAEGDIWKETPELTFFSGSVNRTALAPIIQRFAKREGVRINTVYNGCGILTAQMRSIEDHAAGDFPDIYMACDVYYLKTVADLFLEGVNVSNTPIVIVTQKGNPKDIHSLDDLLKPGIRVVLGQPDQCTIGVLSRNLLQATGIYDTLMKDNVVSETTSSSLLIPAITTGAADAVLAYRTDTLAAKDQIEIIPIDSSLARAVQPFSVARSSNFQNLGKRLLEAISQSRKEFEKAGFEWQLNAPGSLPDDSRAAKKNDVTTQATGTPGS